MRGGRGREGEAVSLPHVLLAHRTELLLASRVQHWGREGKSGGVREGRGREGEAVSLPHVLLSHRTELLLASRVQHWGGEREGVGE